MAIAKEFSKGSVIFKEGAHERFMYIVEKGNVGIYLNYGSPEEKLLITVSANNGTPFFGEMGLLDNSPRSATAVAETDCELRVVTVEEFAAFMCEKPDIILGIMQQMSSRLRGLTGDYMEACHTLLEVEESGGAAQKDTALQKSIRKFADVYRQMGKGVDTFLNKVNRDMAYYRPQ